MRRSRSTVFITIVAMLSIAAKGLRYMSGYVGDLNGSAQH